MGIENPVHLLFLGAVALLVLGPKRLPEVARTLGQGLREFRETISNPAAPQAAAPPPPAAPQPAAAAQPAPAPAASPPPAPDAAPAPAPVDPA